MDASRLSRVRAFLDAVTLPTSEMLASYLLFVVAASLLTGTDTNAATADLPATAADETLRHRDWPTEKYGEVEFLCDDAPGSAIAVGYIADWPYDDFTTRSGIDFNTTQIPDSAKIVNVTLEVTVDVPPSAGMQVLIKPMPVPISTWPHGGAFCEFLFHVIGNQPEPYFVAGTSKLQGPVFIDLGPVAAADLESRLEEDWFTVAFQKQDESPVTQDRVVFRGAGSPRLHVKYIFGAEVSQARGRSEDFGLLKNVPNPFASSTTISFEVPPTGGPVRLAVFDVRGALVRTLVEARWAPGRETVRWDGRDGAGERVRTGIYFARLEMPGYASTRAMTLLR